MCEPKEWCSSSDYFGIIEDIWELDYGTKTLNMALFRCRSIKQHEFNEIRLRVVDLQNIGYQMIHGSSLHMLRRFSI
jgi:hypothetical protein